MKQPIAINYIELQSHDIAATKAFYGELFGWQFTDYGPAYVSFDNAGIDGGFYLTDDPQPGENRTVLFSAELETIHDRVIAYGVTLTRDTYTFPGGERFEFNDPSGNRLAVCRYFEE